MQGSHFATGQDKTGHTSDDDTPLESHVIEEGGQPLCVSRHDGPLVEKGSGPLISITALVGTSTLALAERARYFEAEYGARGLRCRTGIGARGYHWAAREGDVVPVWVGWRGERIDSVVGMYGYSRRRWQGIADGILGLL